MKSPMVRSDGGAAHTGKRRLFKSVSGACAHILAYIPPNFPPIMITAPVLIASALSLGAYGFVRYQRAKRYAKLLREITDIMSIHDHLAEEMLQVDDGIRARWAHQAMVDRDNAILKVLGRGKESMDFDDEDDDEDDKPPMVEAVLEPARDEVPTVHEVYTKVQRKGELVYADKPREVTNHMVLRSRRLYISALVCECKNRFGVPERTNANKLAVRKFALDRMTSHGLRPSHIHQVLPLVVELTFCQSESERVAAAYGEAARSAENGGGPLAWIYRACGGTRRGDLEAF